MFYEEMKEISSRCGAAAVVVLIIGNRVYCASVGDSRAVLSRDGKAINLSVDHKAVNSLINLEFSRDLMRQRESKTMGELSIVEG